MVTSNKDLISKTLAARMIVCIEEYAAIKRKEGKLFKQYYLVILLLLKHHFEKFSRSYYDILCSDL